MAERDVRLIPALDCNELEDAVRIARAVGHLDFVYGFKVGFSLGLAHGLPRVVNQLRAHTNKPIIYDHQKAATDIPATGALFAHTVAAAGVDEAILFPQAGPETLKAWIDALATAGAEIIVGGVKTHPAYLVSEGGFIADEAVTRMYRIAIENGVSRFVVPLTKPEVTEQLYREAGMTDEHRFYSPGLGRQGGDPARFEFLKTHYLIVGRALLSADDPEQYVNLMERQVKSK